MNTDYQKTIWLAIQPFTDEWAALIEKMHGQPVLEHPKRTDFARDVPARLIVMHSQLREAVMSAAVAYGATEKAWQGNGIDFDKTSAEALAHFAADAAYSNLCELERQLSWAIEIASGRALFSVALNAYDAWHFPISNKPGIGGASRRA